MLKGLWLFVDCSVILLPYSISSALEIPYFVLYIVQ